MLEEIILKPIESQEKFSFFKKVRLVFGLAILAIFVSLLLFAGFKYNQKFKNTLDQLSRTDLKDFFTQKTVIRRELVQEESSIINVVDKVSPSVVSIVIKTVDFDVFSGPQSNEDGVGT
jgi:Na+/H+ antiporter NhaC